MIPNDRKHKERMKQSSFIPKPKAIWNYMDSPDPEGMGLHQMQKHKTKRKKRK